MSTRRTFLATCTGVSTWFAGCAAGDLNSTQPVDSESRPSATDVSTGPYWYTHPDPSGNRFVEGAADLRDATPIRIEVDSLPRWLVAHPAPRGSYWTVVTDDGRAGRWHVIGGNEVEEVRLDSRTADSPPVVASNAGEPHLLDDPSTKSPRSGQLVVPETDGGTRPRRIFVSRDGDLVVDGENRDRFSIAAPPDVKPAAVGDGRFVLYGDVTDRYGHGALGDGLEPASLLVADAVESRILSRTVLESPAVFEGLQPIVADVDGDGTPEIVTTVADSRNGARLAIYSLTGERIATGPVYGPGWRHQLAVGPFGPDGETEIAAVLKPHVNRTLEYYRLEDGDLTVRATADGFATHTYGSRNIDGAVAADIDDDGGVEVLLPTSDRRRLASVARTGHGTSVRWTWELGDELRSNLTGVRLEDGGVAVGAATAEEILVWSG